MDKKVYEKKQEWNKRNPEKKKYYEYKSRAKAFITKFSTEEDLKNIIKLCEDRIKDLRLKK